ncbi:MAG: sugar phosphate isomerase/epimerase family protein [Syntrophobacteraceae bacterium]
MAEKQPIAIPTDDATRSVIRRVHVNMPWKRMAQFFDVILNHRMNVEIGFGGEEMDQADPRELERVAEALRLHGCLVSLHGPFWGIEPGCLDPRARQLAAERINQFLDLAVLFRPVRMVCHTGFDPRHHVEYRDFWLEKSHLFWSRMAERAAAMRVPLLVENVWEKEPSFHADLLERVDSPYFGFCLDVGHQHSFSDTPLLSWLDRLSRFLKEIHLHDNDGSHDHHWPVGEGSIDFGGLFEQLKSRGLTPLLTVEPHTEADLIKTLAGLAPLLERCRWPDS